MTTDNAVVATLKEQGHRVTPAREALLQVFATAEKPLSAVELGVQLKKKRLGVNKTTIYREITFLLEQQIIHEIQFGDDKKYFELAGSEHHHHLRCVSCNAVEDIELPHDATLYQKEIERKTKFTVMRHALEFFGLCAKCQ